MLRVLILYVSGSIYSFIVDFERQIFCETFHGNFTYFQNFCQKEIFFLFCFRLAWFVWRTVWTVVSYDSYGDFKNVFVPFHSLQICTSETGSQSCKCAATCKYKIYWLMNQYFSFFFIQTFCAFLKPSFLPITINEIFFIT